MKDSRHREFSPTGDPVRTVRRGLTLGAVLLLSLVAGTAFALPPSRQGPVDPQTGSYISTGRKSPQFPKELLQPRFSAKGGGFAYSSSALYASQAGGRPLAVNPAPGSSMRPLVVLLDFADKPRTLQPTDMALLFFDTGPASLSVANYWKEVSYGQFTVTGSGADIIGWLRPAATPSQPGEFFSTITSYSQITDPVTGVNLANLSTLIRELVAYLDTTGGLNFALYADPATGIVQSLTILHAGTGQEDTGLSADLYSHEASISGGPIGTNDSINGTPVAVADYIALPEQLSFNPATGANTPVRITPGVVVHEMGHLLGLPDLYPVSGTEGQTGTFSGVGVFDLMGYGLWGSNFLDRPDNPAHLSAWSKAFLGWLVPTLRTGTAGLTLPPVEGFPQVDKVYSNTVADPGQYFLVENRQVAGTWLFDKFLLAPTGGGAGILIWQIDNEVITANPFAVNVDPAFRGVYVKEADGVYHMALPIPSTGTPNDRAVYFGVESDFFNQNPLGGQPRVFSRTLPSATVNSTPIFSSVHPFDFGTEVTMADFLQRGTGNIDYLLSIVPGGGGAAAAWKTFNVASTMGAYPTPMRGNDILSLGFDSGNNTWMGSRDQGIFRFLGSDFSILNTLQGLPGPGTGAPPGATVARIQAMTFEAATGSMWVGTDRGLYKMRDSGSGFRVVTSFTSASPLPRTLPASEAVQAVAVRRGSDLKYIGTPVGFLRMGDGLTDADADDMVGVILTGNATAIAIDDSGTDDMRDDIVWVGFSDGRLMRSLLPSEGGPPTGDPVIPGHFRTYTLAGSPNVRVSSLAVDNKGILWIGTDRGVQAFDLGETATPPQPNLRDPYDFNGNGDLATEAYLDFNVVADVDGVFGSNKVTGIGFESAGLPLPVAWISQRSDGFFFPGGATRFNANLINDIATSNRDERLKVYSPIPPSDVPMTFGRSSSASAVAGDAAGNVWFATTQPAISSFPFDQANGVVRFGNAGVLSLDRVHYIGTTAVATAILLDDGLNASPSVVDTAVVRVTSATDATGFLLTLAETGPDTGIFSGAFGFTNGSTDAVGKRINVQVGSVVTVIYTDSSPPGVRAAVASWHEAPPPRHFPTDPVPQASSVSFGLFARKDGRAVERNDEVAAFCVHQIPGFSPVRWGYVLAGWGRVDTTGAFPQFPVYGDSLATPAAVEGCLQGQEVSLVLWSALEGKEYHAYVDGATGNPAAAVWDNSLSLTTADLNFVEGTRIPLRTGAWSLFSYGVLKGWHKGTPPATAQLDNVTWEPVTNVGDSLPLKSIVGKYDRVMANDGTGATFWNPALPGVSSLSYLAPGYGYWVKMKPSPDNQALAWMTVPGSLTTGAESLALNSGWTLTGYWGNVRTWYETGYDWGGKLLPLTATEFAPLASIGDIWSSISGNYARVTSFDDQGAHLWNPILPATRTLRYLGPGYGYWIKMNASGTLTYPTGSR